MVVKLCLNPHIVEVDGLHYLMLFIKNHYTLCILAGISSGSGLSVIMILTVPLIHQLNMNMN